MNIINFLSKFSGIMSVLIISLSFAIIWSKSKFDFQKNTLSDCGSNQYSKQFNITLIVFALLQILFVYTLTQTYIYQKIQLVMIAPVTAGILLFFTTIFDTKHYNKFHDFLSYTSFIILGFWSLLFHHLLINTNYLIGTLGLVISLILGLGTLILYKIHGKCAIPEIYFIIMVMVWNLYFSYVLFF